MADLHTSLEAAIRAGDLTDLLTLLRAVPAPERGRQRAAVMALVKAARAVRWGDTSGSWKAVPTPSQQRCLDAAAVLCGTAADLLDAVVTDADLLVSLCREFRPRCLEGLVEALRHPAQWVHVMLPLIAAGVVERPDSEGYALGLIALPGVVRSPERLDALFAADPGLRPSLLRVFSIEGTGDVSLASSDKYNSLQWAPLLLSLVDDGFATRAQLLDLTLGALEKDWPQYRAGWFSRFHVEMKPTAAELQPHLPRYLALCASRIPPTVTLALDVLKQLDEAGPLPGEGLLAALAPVMTSAGKAQVEAALKLLDRVAKREPALAGQAAEAVVPALLHEASSVQAGVLKRLEAWGLTPAARARLGEFAATVAAAHQPRLQRLLGEQPAAMSEPVEVLAEPARPPRPLDDARRLPPGGDLQELVECIAHVFEHADDVDAFERAVASLVMAAPLAAADRQRFAPVARRASKVRKPLAQELARLLCFVLEGRRTPRRIDPDLGDSLALTLLSERMDALMTLAAQGQRLMPLAFPTHRGGFIAAEALAERIAAHAAAGVRIAEIEQVQALLRLVPGSAPAEIAQGLPDSPLARAFRYALGDAIEPGPEAALFAAAARIRHPGADDAALDRRHPGLGPDGARVATYAWDTVARSWEVEGKTYTHHDLRVLSPPAPRDTPLTHIAVLRHLPTGREPVSWPAWSFCGREAGLVRYGASLLPSDVEAWCAEGARAFGNNLDWWEAQWHNRAYLDVLLDGVLPLMPMARLMLVLALCGKEPGQTATAVDLLLQAHGQGRLPLDAGLTDLVCSLFATPLPKAARLVKSLQAGLRAQPQLHGLAFAVLCAVIRARPADPPRDTGAVLELLLELKLRHALPLPDDALAALAGMKLGGNSRKLQASLLA